MYVTFTYETSRPLKKQLAKEIEIPIQMLGF